MSSFASYKLHKAKAETNVTWFKCAYCGKYQCRRTSKIKNPNLIFCDNSCRAKYVSKKSLEFNYSEDEIKHYYKKFYTNICIIASNVASQSNISDIYNDLKNQAPYCIMKCLKNKRHNALKIEYFSRTFKLYLKSYLNIFEYMEHPLSINYYDVEDKNLLFEYFEDLDFKADTILTINKMKRDMEKLPISCKIALCRELYGLSLDDLMSKFKMTRNQVIKNCSMGKKLLRIKYAEK